MTKAAERYLRHMSNLLGINDLAPPREWVRVMRALASITRNSQEYSMKTRIVTAAALALGLALSAGVSQAQRSTRRFPSTETIPAPSIPVSYTHLRAHETD